MAKKVLIIETSLRTGSNSDSALAALGKSI